LRSRGSIRQNSAFSTRVGVSRNVSIAICAADSAGHP
jgi:hypothetical protein